VQLLEELSFVVANEIDFPIGQSKIEGLSDCEYTSNASLPQM
jgi:hypothetical protein